MTKEVRTSEPENVHQPSSLSELCLCQDDTAHPSTTNSAAPSLHRQIGRLPDVFLGSVWCLLRNQYVIVHL